MDDWLQTTNNRKTEGEETMAGGSLLEGSVNKSFDWDDGKRESGHSFASESLSNRVAHSSCGGGDDGDSSTQQSTRTAPTQ